ncbi:MAG: holo-ACP synthase [Verrucomicrobia bacterium]|nr:holo-ACP synthase [Verrucomicrobiota bacterium]
MDLQVGIDIIEIERVRASIQEHGERFLNRLFTATERAYCDQYQDSAPRYAGRFACKESVIKALGSSRGWHDIEIVNDNAGRPIAHLSEDYSAQFGYPQLQISISHCRTYATAICIVLKKKESL